MFWPFWAHFCPCLGILQFLDFAITYYHAKKSAESNEWSPRKTPNWQTDRKTSYFIGSNYQKKKAIFHICCSLASRSCSIFVNYETWQNSRYVHFEALKTLKTLWFLEIRLWIPQALFSWTLPRVLQLSMYMSWNGHLLSCIGECHPK